MSINEQKVTGKRYRVWDSTHNIWKRLSFWTKASDVELNDGTTVEAKIDELKSSLTASDNLEFNFTKNGNKYGYKDSNGTFVPFKTVQASKAVTASTSTQTVTPDSGYDGVGQVTVNPQSHTGIVTLSSKYETGNGYDMGINHANRYVKTSGLMVTPTATKSITANGNNIDVLDYAKVNVNVSSASLYTQGSFNVPFGTYSGSVNLGFKPSKVVVLHAGNTTSTRATGWYLTGTGFRFTSSIGNSYGLNGVYSDASFTVSITATGFSYSMNNTGDLCGTFYYLALK